MADVLLANEKKNAQIITKDGKRKLQRGYLVPKLEAMSMTQSKVLPDRCINDSERPM